MLKLLLPLTIQGEIDIKYLLILVLHPFIMLLLLKQHYIRVTTIEQ